MQLTREISSILEKLESRSRAESERLDELRIKGGSAIRDVADELMLDVGRDSGLFLNMMVRATGAKTIVEVGASVGYSTIWLAEAAQANGGKIWSFEVSDKKREQLASHLRECGLLDYVEIRSEEIPAILSKLPSTIDLIFLDHWKEIYLRDFKQLWPKLRPGGLVLSDNIIKPEKNRDVIQQFLQSIRAMPDVRSVTIDVGSGIEVTCKEF